MEGKLSNVYAVEDNQNGAHKGRAVRLAIANKKLMTEIARRKQLESALRESQEALQRLSKQALAAGEEERKRISRELHDEVGQALSAINVNLAMIRRLKLERVVETQVADLQGLLEQTMEKIHGFARELRPAMLEHLGLIPALQAFVRSFGKRTGLHIRFHADPEAENLGPEEKLVLYRVTQEGLTNVLKHAQAKRATVVIRRIGSAIRIEVRDNGKAFQTAKMNSVSHQQRLGLVGIQERVRLVQGEFIMRSRAGLGTTLRVEIPHKICGTKSN